MSECEELNTLKEKLGELKETVAEMTDTGLKRWRTLATKQDLINYLKKEVLEA